MRFLISFLGNLESITASVLCRYALFQVLKQVVALDLGLDMESPSTKTKLYRLVVPRPESWVFYDWTALNFTP